MLSITLLLENLSVVFFVLRECMVRNFQFLLLLASQPFSLMDHLIFRHVCCSCASLGNPYTLYWHVLGDACYQFCQLHQSWIFCWRLRSVFSGNYQVRLLGVSLVFFVALSWRIPCVPSSVFLNLSCSVYSLWR